MGSGTAGVACKNTNRKFIGIEMDKEIYDLAYKELMIIKIDKKFIYNLSYIYNAIVLFTV